MDITQLILDDHAEFRRLFAMIEQIGRDDVDAAAAIWKRLGALLDTHAEAEERFFYPDLLRVGEGAGDADSAAGETRDAIKDHNKIRDAAAAVEKEIVGSDAWFEAIDAANLENSEHMAEEERQGLTDFRRTSPVAKRHKLAIGFAGFEAAHLTGVAPINKDPKAYVASGGEVASAARTARAKSLIE